ncbi:MAG TPA: acetate--CoA ligase family protein [Ignavibacteria bacterium]|nr:acetate--CoA ligase family protein [Ignavibacteria bacterium]
MDKFFSPKSIAIIGASSKKGTLSWDLVHNLIEFGFTGKVFPVNPNADSVHSIKTYKSVIAIEDEVDLAIIMVPKEFVCNTIDECGKKKIKAVIVITAGFKESGSEGVLLEDKLKEQIKKFDMQLVGPNCMGIINTLPDIRLNATFVHGEPIRGGIGFVSQSGALGAAVLKTVQQYDIGLAQFISIGNKADVSGNTVIEYWKNHPAIKVITVYLESFGNPKRFMELTRETTKNKPVIVIKSARTKAGIRAASSHTGALATSDAIVDAFLAQAGVIRVNNIEEMFDVARGFDRAKLPKCNRVAILTNAGGPAILAVDVSANSGLIVPELSKKTQARLKKIAPPEGPVNNPVDLLPPATSSMYKDAVKIILQDNNIDSLIAILGPPIVPNTVEIAKAICEGMKGSDKTNTLVLMSQDDVIPMLAEALPDHPPVYRFPEAAARVIGEMYKYKVWKNQALGRIVKFKSGRDTVNKIIRRHKSAQGNYLPFNDVCQILNAYGLPVIETLYAENLEELYNQSKSINYPVVLKASGKKLIHKSDAGGVITGIYGEEMLLSSAERIIKNLKHHKKDKLFEQFIIQPYITGGVETIIGVSKDEKAGHLLMFGLGGIYVEVLKDVVFRLLPITEMEACNMIQSIKSYKILQGIRGNKPVDIEFIRECMLRLSQLLTDFPEISELDLNPFIFTHNRKDCRILDARIRL